MNFSKITIWGCGIALALATTFVAARGFGPKGPGNQDFGPMQSGSHESYGAMMGGAGHRGYGPMMDGAGHRGYGQMMDSAEHRGYGPMMGAASSDDGCLGGQAWSRSPETGARERNSGMARTRH